MTSLLGRGSYSDVKIIDPDVATKITSLSIPTINEIFTLKMLDHPYIIKPISHSIVNDEVVHINMPIYTKLHESQIDDKIEFCYKLIDTVGQLNRYGIYHFDIKPENILVHEGNPMLIDFGLSIANIYGLDMHPRLVYTSAYRPMEVMFNKENIDYNKCETYALGITIMEILSGVCPSKFTNNILSGIRKQNRIQSYALSQQYIQYNYIPKVSNLLPQAIKDLVLSMVSEKPDRRPNLSDLVRDTSPKLSLQYRYTTDYAEIDNNKLKSIAYTIDNEIGDIIYRFFRSIYRTDDINLSPKSCRSLLSLDYLYVSRHKIL